MLWEKSKKRFYKITFYSHTGLSLKSWVHVSEFEWMWDYRAIRFKHAQSETDSEDFELVLIKEGIILIEEELTKNIEKYVKEINYCKCRYPEPGVTSPIDTVDTCKICCKIIKGSNI